MDFSFQLYDFQCSMNEKALSAYKNSKYFFGNFQMLVQTDTINVKILKLFCYYCDTFSNHAA